MFQFSVTTCCAYDSLYKPGWTHHQGHQILPWATPIVYPQRGSLVEWFSLPHTYSNYLIGDACACGHWARIYESLGNRLKKFLSYITFTGNKTKKTDESFPASLRSSTRAETAVDEKAVSVDCKASAGIEFVTQDLLGVNRWGKQDKAKAKSTSLIAHLQLEVHRPPTTVNQHATNGKRI